MAVFTEVSADEARGLLHALGLGELRQLRGIEGGIENTNYFATTDGGEYVLTLFERLRAAQLPFYLELMQHLARRGIPVPDPASNSQGELVHQLAGKPAAVVNRLRGSSRLQPGARECAAMGRMLARMHLAARDFDARQPNLRGLPWWNETAPSVLPHLDAGQASLLKSELAFQNHIAGLSAYAALPRGPVHADVFRDNVMFEGDELTGVFDFYFAGIDTWLFDLAVCLNDWCTDPATGVAERKFSDSLLAAYTALRPLGRAERELLPAMLRAGALRFWVSRLWDLHLPRNAAMLRPHDPVRFERILRERIRQPLPA
jgi:homoserine kinase type II